MVWRCPVRLFLFLLLTACTDTIDTDVPFDTDTDADTDAPEHACERAKLDAFDRGAPWTPTDVTACYEGDADARTEANFDQGRLTCITGGDYCPTCVADRGRGVPYQIGYEAAYAEVYAAGYAEAGC